MELRLGPGMLIEKAVAASGILTAVSDVCLKVGSSSNDWWPHEKRKFEQRQA